MTGAFAFALAFVLVDEDAVVEVAAIDEVDEAAAAFCAAMD